MSCFPRNLWTPKLRFAFLVQHRRGGNPGFALPSVLRGLPAFSDKFPALEGNVPPSAFRKAALDKAGSFCAWASLRVLGKLGVSCDTWRAAALGLCKLCSRVCV